MRTTIRLSILVGFIASISLAGCGVRGPLQPPSKNTSMIQVEKKVG
ncbi:MAG: LPS translocon maturation chaperone LptM [Methyloligellaceae bacterium]